MPYYTRNNPPPFSGIALRLRKKHINRYAKANQITTEDVFNSLPQFYHNHTKIIRT